VKRYDNLRSKLHFANHCIAIYGNYKNLSEIANCNAIIWSFLTPMPLYVFAYLAPGCGVGAAGIATAGTFVTTTLDIFYPNANTFSYVHLKAFTQTSLQAINVNTEVKFHFQTLTPSKNGNQTKLIGSEMCSTCFK